MYFDAGSQEVTAKGNVIDMAKIKDHGEEVYAISIYNTTIKNINASGNYATYDAIRNNNATECSVETPIAYTKGEEPEEVQEIIAASAFALK